MSKKLLFPTIAVMLSFCGNHALGQSVPAYGFSQSTENYTPLENATMVNDANAELDDETFLVDIPFDFPFDGVVYNNLYISTNGHIALGTIEPLASSQPLSAADNDECHAIISPYGTDLIGLLNHETFGNAHINTYANLTETVKYFVIEWKNFVPYSFNGTFNNAIVDFQLFLFEDGKIQFKYNPKSTMNFLGQFPSQIGIRAQGANNFKSRHANGDDHTFTNSIASSTATQNVIVNATKNSIPTHGLCFSWTIPQNCTSPTTQATNLIINTNQNGISGSFTPATDADGYLILRTPVGETHNLPTDETIYTTGFNESLNATVVQNSNQTQFTDNTNLIGNTAYTYTIYAKNSECINGPLFSNSEPLTANAVSCPKGIATSTVANITNHSFNLSWTSNINGTADTVYTSIEISKNDTFTEQIQQSPFTVNGNSLSVTNLEPNTTYYYRLKNQTTCESAYSTVKSIKTNCNPITEFFEGFENTPDNELPSCWNKLISTTYGSPEIFTATTHNSDNSSKSGIFRSNISNLNDTNNRAILVSPYLSNITAGTHQLRFRAKLRYSDLYLQVVALSDYTPNAELLEIATIPTANLSAEYNEFTIPVVGITGDYKHIGIRLMGTEGYEVINIDNIYWEAIPTTEPCIPTFQYGADSNVITQVLFEEITNNSPFHNPAVTYEDFTSHSTNVRQGNTYEISVKGPSSTFPSDVMVYIDFNQNNDFSDAGESFYIGRISPANPANAIPITSTISIPATATLGATKMRIIKNTNVPALSNPNAPNSITEPCASLRAGQIEDYTVVIQEPLANNKLDANLVKIYPNPASSIVKIEINSNVKNIELFDITGKKLLSTSETTININHLNTGIYIINIETTEGEKGSFKIVKQ